MYATIGWLVLLGAGLLIEVLGRTPPRENLDTGSTRSNARITDPWSSSPDSDLDIRRCSSIRALHDSWSFLTDQTDLTQRLACFNQLA